SGTYMMIGVVLLVLLVIIFFTRMPADRDTSGRWDFKATLGRLWKNKRYRYGVIAQFFYVGAQTCVWSFTIRLAMHRMGILEKEASMMFLYSILAFTAFRFLFTWLMKYVRPIYLLAGASVVAIVTCAGVLLPDDCIAVTALISVSAAMSLMFPTIYGIALDGIHGDDTKIAASGLIMAILGGAVITPVQAAVSDHLGITLSFIVPLFCFAVILLYSAGIIKSAKNSLK
ncbi:MAG: MFS transporter, partial [Duncaniella sp.]|nr:MFS transporter [Duncaniella sp.]